MIKTTKAQFLKQVVGVMVAIGMNPMPPKDIWRKACLWASLGDPFGLSKDLRPKRCPNI